MLVVKTCRSKELICHLLKTAHDCMAGLFGANSDLGSDF